MRCMNLGGRVENILHQGKAVHEGPDEKQHGMKLEGRVRGEVQDEAGKANGSACQVLETVFRNWN